MRGRREGRPRHLAISTLALAFSIAAITLAQPGPSGWPVTFTDIAAAAGLRSPSIYGNADRTNFIIEANGACVALIDSDRDGWLDALVLSGTRLDDSARRDASFPPGQAPSNRLYRNLHDGRFEDVPDAAGLWRAWCSSSVCVGDVDNDGWPALFVTAYGQNVLYRN